MADYFDIPGKKSTFYAKKFLNIARAKFKKQKYFEALENFNKSLCFSEADSDEAALAYEGRDEVYIELKQFSRCLESEKFSKCRVDESALCCERGCSDDLWSFFKLSYPVNEKIPFIVDCLKLKNDASFGRFLTTTRNLQPGDIIAIEDPFFKIIDIKASAMRCANCLKSNKMNLIPSRLCSSGEKL